MCPLPWRDEQQGLMMESAERGPPMMDQDDFRYGHMNNGVGWLIALLLLGLLIAAVVALIVYAVTRSSATPDSGPPTKSDAGQARQILDERLARGEIAPDEYRERRNALDA